MAIPGRGSSVRIGLSQCCHASSPIFGQRGARSPGFQSSRSRNVRVVSNEDYLEATGSGQAEAEVKLRQPLPLTSPLLNPPSQLAITQRILHVGVSASKFISVLASNRWEKAVLGVDPGSQRAARTLQELLTELGPAFVKLAQTLSMRPDLVGDVYAGSLTKLQDNVDPFPNDIAYEILEEELGKPLDQIFISLSPNPVASASLGQVYRGILRPEYGNGGGIVAVKVQRPGAAESIALDIRLLRMLLGAVQRALGTTRDLRVLADEIGTGLQGECDFRNEVFNAKEFARAHAALQFVTTPCTIDELCTRRVLVSEWVDGRGPTQLLMSREDSDASQQSTGSDVLSLVRMGIQCSLAQLLITGCMHGDPHSGNLLLTNDGKLCYLDFGLIVNVSARHRQAMMAALIHLGLGEWSRLVDDLEQLDLLKSGTDRAMLAQDLQREFTAVLADAVPSGEDTLSSGTLTTQLPLLTLQTSSLSFSTLAGVLFKVAFKYRFLLPSYFPLVVRSVASLEGVALSVDPNFKLVAAGMPVVLNQLLSDRRPAAQALLQELLLSPGGALRTDDTTRQILQVWLSAAQQAARADAIISGNAAADDAAALSGPSSAVDMTNLLLDRRNVPLRRTLMTSNPAETIAKMPKDMRCQLLKVLTESLSSEEGSTIAAELFQRSPAARAQRKRLYMLFKASVPKVLNSSPASIWQLVLFSFAVMFAFIRACWSLIWKKISSWLACIYHFVIPKGRKGMDNVPCPPLKGEII